MRQDLWMVIQDFEWRIIRCLVLSMARKLEDFRLRGTDGPNVGQWREGAYFSGPAAAGREYLSSRVHFRVT